MALDIIPGLVGTVLKYTLAPVIRHAGYAFRYAKKVRELEKQAVKLRTTRDSLQNLVEQAKRSGDEIQPDVEEWLTDAENAIQEARELTEREEEEAKKKCFAGGCPNLKTRYQLGKKAAKDALHIRVLEEEGKFDRSQISYRAPPQQIVSSSVHGFEGLPSRASVFKKVMDALSDPNVNRISVYGPGGAGKTTLAKEVHKQALEGNSFDVVARLELLEKPDLKAIQTRIAEVLGLKFDAETVDGRADELRQRLMKESRVLIILDNLWDKIDLEKMGIPLTNEKSVKGRGAHSVREGFQFNSQLEPIEREKNYLNECKLLMTSRDLQLLMCCMDVEQVVKLDVLDEGESYTLFERMVGGIKDSRLQPIAKKVARKCAGLPLLLCTLAGTLKDKQFETWKDTLNRLSTPEDEKIKKEFHPVLELSYDHLPTEEVKSFFLLFGLFTYPDIPISDLLKYSMGLGLLRQVHTMEDARIRVHQLIENLKASCLLSDSETDGFVKIHDIVQDVAASIAFRTQHAFKKAGATSEDFQRIDIKRCTRIFLEDTDVFEFPTKMFPWPEIVFFRLSPRDRSLQIPDSAFEGMMKLQVLDFTDMHFSSLPPSLGSLTSLYTLCLDFCRLEDISVITQLMNLEILSLSGSQIVDLPRDLAQLTRLKLLDLSNCSKLEFIPENVFSQLSLLEELLIGDNSFVNWEVKRPDTQSNASLSELEHLSRLTNLEIHVPDAKKLPMRLFSEGLERYKIFIGDMWDWDGEYQTSKTLKLKLNTSIHRKHGVKTLLKDVEDLYLDEMKGIANVLYDIHSEGFQQLKHLHVQNSGEIRRIMDSERRVHPSAFPVLESLILHNLVNLDKICRGKLMAEDFCKLSIVRVTSCDRLKNLFPLSVVRRNLQQLREMEIMGCNDMEVIFVDESEEEGDDENEVVEFTQLNSLKLGLPQLRSFCSKVRESPASTSTSHSRQNQSASDVPFKEIVSARDTSFPVFNGKIIFSNLKEMFLSSINVDKMWDDQFADSFRKLTSLTVEACRNLNYLFTSSTLKNLAQLQKLEIRRCNLMKDVIATEGEIIGKAAFPNLEYLQLEGLPKLSTFCTGDLIEFPNLKELGIEDCPELKTFVSDPVAVNTGSELALFDEKVAFPKLEQLRIVNMDGLKMIWHTELHECSFRILKSMIVKRAKELLNIFPSAMLMSRLLNLEDLELDDCASLEEVFNFQVQALINSRTQGLPASRLRTLRIRNMQNLKLIWNKHPQDREIISFYDLQVVEAYKCPNLKSVFSVSIARGLLQLEKVDLILCGIEEIVGRDEGTEAIARFEFPELTTLRLQFLFELKTFYPGMHTCEWPILKTLNVRDCPNIELFTSESGSVGETCRGSQLDNPPQEPFFSVQKGIHHLEELTLGIKNARMIRAAQIPASFFDAVRCLRLEGSDEESASLSFDLLRRFRNLERLKINKNGLEEMFSCEGSVGGENQGSISTGDCQLERTFEHIETLELSLCHSLISLAPSIASFGNLSHLDVWGCDGLLNLVTSSAAQFTRHLTTLRVSWCDLVEEIVAREEDDREDQITWDNLESLELCGLGSLTCFSSARHTFQFPSLEEVIVTRCPKMKTFSGGISITPKIKGVKVESGDAEGRWEGDLNTTIQKLCADLVGQLRGIWRLKLSEFPELKAIWTKENFPANVLSQLLSLVVDECVFNSNAVPSNLLRSLDNLRWLEVKNCDLVEEIFDLAPPNASDGQIKTLPELHQLQLIDLPRLKQVWKEDPNGVFHLRSLKELKIHNCSTLRYLFTPTTCLGLVHLQELEVKSCPLIEEIITNGAASGSTVDNIMFQQLNSVSLESLPNLASFYSGSGTVQCASLKIITIIECSSTFSSAFLNECPPFNTNGATQPKVLFPNLEKLTLSSIGVENMWRGQFVDQSTLFSRLTNLAVEGCENLNYLLSPSTAKSFSLLQQLKICDCKSMEEVVVAEGEMPRKMFPRLEFLQLKGLPKLFRFCLGDEIEFPCLEELWIENCLELKTFISNHFTASTAAILALFDGKVALPMLTTLQVLNLDRLKMIWHNELHKESFCKLKNLTVKHCRELSKIFPSIMLTRFKDLEQLDVRDCDSLEEVFNLQVLMDIKETHEEMVTQLRTVYLGNLPNLKHIWKENRQINISFRSLRLAHVWDCPLLKSIFPASVAEGLPQLKDLNIDSCGVEEIVAVEGAGGKEAPITRFMFPKLNSLTLWKLSKLDKFYPGIHTTEWPALKTLNVKRCDKMKLFSFESRSLQGPCEEEQPDIQVPQPLFSFQEVVPGLEELSLNNEDATMIWKSQFPANLFDKVRALQLNCFHDQSTVSPFECLHRFRNVEKLLVACSQFKELFASEELFDKEEHKRALAQIRHLKLDCLPDLEHIWNQESQPDHVLPRLSTLEVLNCDNLRNLAPSYASFRSLTALEMKKCHGLINIVASSTAKTLVHLRTMRIIECNVVTEIVPRDGWKTEEEITFKRLVTLELNCLPSLCSANHSFKFPSLTEVIVSQCPKMEFFSKGALIASKLERVKRTGEDDEGRWHRNLNATIQQLLFTERMLQMRKGVVADLRCTLDRCKSSYLFN